MSRLSAWKAAFRFPQFWIQFSVTFIGFVLVMRGFTQYLEFNEIRVGALLPDPILSRMEAIDLTWPIFAVIYASMILALWQTARSPRRFLMGFQCYALIILFRWLGMFLTPLEPPQGMIVLKDPFVEFFGASGNPLTKDLFFSGHTASMFMFFLLLERGWLKRVLLLGTLFVACGVLLQKVHYFVDVWTAPFFAYTSFRIVSILHRIYGRESRIP